MAPRALRSLDSNNRCASASEIRSPAATLSKRSRSSLRWTKKFTSRVKQVLEGKANAGKSGGVSALPQSEPALENHFRGHDDEKDRAHDCVESKESDIDPIQTPAPRNP